MRRAHLWMVRMCWVWSGLCGAAGRGEEPTHLPGTELLQPADDWSEQMVAGIDRYLRRATAESVGQRAARWQRDLSSGENYARSVEPNRQRLRELIGAVDPRVSPPRLEYVAAPDSPELIGETDRFRALAVRWTVVDGVQSEGLLLEPKQRPVARLVVVPDADRTVEAAAGFGAGGDRTSYARRLAEAGCQVLVVQLLSRENTWSGNPAIFMTDQTHREWVWRQGYDLGRTVIGYEVQTVQAAIDWLRAQDEISGTKTPLGLAGEGEGGLIALYAAALDVRVDAALVSGYFDSRQRLADEPIYRSVFGLLREFGDAEIASLVAPRQLVIEHSLGPHLSGPPAEPADRRRTAAPGAVVPPAWDAVRAEFQRAQAMTATAEGNAVGSIALVSGEGGAPIGPGASSALQRFLERLGARTTIPDSNPKPLTDARRNYRPGERQRRLVAQWVDHSQRLLRRSEQTRAEYWKDAVPTSADSWPQATAVLKQRLWDELIGRLPGHPVAPHMRSRRILDRPGWTGYEVVQDVRPDVIAWGYLLIPKGLKPDERRGVVVCQHGLEGLPESVVTEDTSRREYQAYRAYAVRLAEQGFVVYAPHNPYRGGTRFRQLQRQAHPLGLTLYSFILDQHERTLDWLSGLPYVDPQRIGFYGLSYGGTSAVRIPALLDRYALSICSAAFNDWPRKIASLDFRAAYQFTAEYDHFSWRLSSTFSNAELAALIAPRPFMVERGHDDAVAPDEWVAHEYAKVRRLYSRLGIPVLTEIEYFPGGHEIHGVGTFKFLRKHLAEP